MATVLDLTILEFLKPLFIFLLIFAIIYGLLEKTKLFGEGKTINLIIAICLAAVASVFTEMVDIMSTFFSWIVILVAFLLMVFLLYGSFGVDQQKVWKIFGVAPIFLIILVIIIIILVTVFSDKLSPYKTTANVSTEKVISENGTVITKTPQSEALKTLTHPRILAAIVLLIITAIAARFIVDKVE